jgi:hypothetical protein
MPRAFSNILFISFFLYNLTMFLGMTSFISTYFWNYHSIPIIRVISGDLQHLKKYVWCVGKRKDLLFQLIEILSCCVDITYFTSLYVPWSCQDLHCLQLLGIALQNGSTCYWLKFRWLGQEKVKCFRKYSDTYILHIYKNNYFLVKDSWFCSLTKTCTLNFPCKTVLQNNMIHVVIQN